MFKTVINFLLKSPIKIQVLLIVVCCAVNNVLFGQQSVSVGCNIGSLPSIQFRSNSATLLPSAKQILDNAASQLMANPTCKVKLMGYASMDKRGQQLSWDHVNTIKNYLIEQQGIAESRVIFTYGFEGNGTMVDLVPTTEDGPQSVPPPVPALRH